MKKRILFIVALAILACLFVVCASAKEYSPANGQELNSAIAEAITLGEDCIINLNGSYTDYKQDAGYTAINAGKITFELTGNTEIACRFVINGVGTAIFNLNQYELSNNTSRGGENGCFFFIDDDGVLEMYNGTVKINDVALLFQDGTLKLKDIFVDANEEAIWARQGGCDNTGGRTYQIEDCRLSGKDGVNIYCINDNSYIKNVVCERGSVAFDSWHDHGNKNCEAVLENITVVDKRTNFWTSSNIYTLKNCTLAEVQVNGDRGGTGYVNFYDVTYTTRHYTDKKGVLYDYKSPSCTEYGSLTVYATDDQDGTVDNEYLSTDAAKPLGHESDPNKTGDIHYDSYLEDGMLAVCKRCGITMADENIKAAPLFKFLGYSTPEDGSYGIVASFIVDTKAISQYEEMTGKTLTYGIVAAGKQNLGDISPLDENGNAAILSNGSVVKAEIGREYASYDFVLTGMNENQLDTELVIATYVEVTKNEETTVVYLQETQKSENLSVISYNAIPKVVA